MNMYRSQVKTSVHKDMPPCAKSVRNASKKMGRMTPKYRQVRIHAMETVADTTSNGLSLVSALGLGGAATAAFVALKGITDPEKRRQQMAMESGGSELKSVETYFEGEGFQRWRRIYDDQAEDVNKVQKDIREGHAQTIDKAVKWLTTSPDGSRVGIEGMTVCDAGCGTGSLTIPIALEGAKVSASDISSAMVKEASERFSVAASSSSNQNITTPEFEANDLESISGKYDTVTCLDVLIHYPDEKMYGMLQHLSSLAEKRLVLSFAPKTPYYSILKRIGELFPGPSKATRAYLHSEEDIEQELNRLGWTVRRRDMTATSFYFSRMLEIIKN